MPLLYAGWFKIVGFGKLQSRALSIALHCAGLFALILWLRNKMKLTQDAVLLLYIGFTTLPVLVWACVGCRLEVFAFLFFTWFLSIAFRQESLGLPGRLSAIAFGAVTLLTGMHFAGYYALALILLFAIQRDRVSFARGLYVAAGMSLGAIALWLFYKQTGAWDAFIDSRTSHYDGKAMAWVPRGWRMFFVSPDIAVMEAIVLISLLFAICRPDLVSKDLRKSMTYCAILFVIVPAAMNAIGIFYVSYAWMIALPVLVILAPYLSQIPARFERWLVSSISLAAIPYLALVGFRLSRDMDLQRQQAAVAAYLSKHASPTDAIAASNMLYYTLKPEYPDLRLQPQMPAWPARMYDDLRWATASADDVGRITKKRSSEWDEVARFPLGSTTERRDDDCVVLRRRARPLP